MIHGWFAPFLQEMACSESLYSPLQDLLSNLEKSFVALGLYHFRDVMYDASVISTDCLPASYQGLNAMPSNACILASELASCLASFQLKLLLLEKLVKPILMFCRWNSDLRGLLARWDALSSDAAHIYVED